MNNKNNPSVSIYESIKDIAAQNRQNEESKNFNHFLETGETIPAKEEGQYLIEALADITRLVRPGPLSGGETLVKKALIEHALIEVVETLNPGVAKKVVIVDEPFSTQDILKKP